MEASVDFYQQKWNGHDYSQENNIMVVQTYLSEQTSPRKSNPLHYWKDNVSRFPSLAAVATRFLCAPCTSVDSERLFSAVSNVLDEKRNRLSPDRWALRSVASSHTANYPGPRQTTSEPEISPCPNALDTYSSNTGQRTPLQVMFVSMKHLFNACWERLNPSRDVGVWLKIDHGSGLDTELYDRPHRGLNGQRCLMNDPPPP
ncbi:hypothetical protein F7725_027738 [Dissostichus mawsoni]|uniref:HAT C-terminal dimerisation domain-containing protein n=1 Tax=Dissostichus mawsoni TaxID=36200 RepID=A0A7J5XDU5_DISMA|nr:hypothetical protein F7725_027738 [Dissostichus mawsoni]